MLIRFASALACILAPSMVAGCGGRPGCVIDTDCPLGQYCDVDQRCTFVGDGNDSGTGGVDAARSDGGDAGSTDAARDAPSVDAIADAPMSDGGAVDAAGDAAVDAAGDTGR